VPVSWQLLVVFVEPDEVAHRELLRQYRTRPLAWSRHWASSRSNTSSHAESCDPCNISRARWRKAVASTILSSDLKKRGASRFSGV
jgi:hypothetical protein